ncbi:pre-miRNA 5'-monophosphate methyltransferase [Diaphorina citri]|uniref:RNA methyltransferase n=1 Tax=Diaphorina citri TaxID=121845 RepID=A0A1S3DJJ1_DIACI|nr:pre-miRNA 5'-monophosphate methyltransferase [Diaphorina citri]XP_017303968.1 pre-miRNA 5'-monophosphate methyltransferase [Diaphorina citri]
MSDKDTDKFGDNTYKSNDKDGFDPGAMMFGNFINYYQFHPPEDRIKLLTSHIWEQLELEKQEGPIVCLDVGCNCGDLTESLYDNLEEIITSTSDRKQIKVLGIDIDGTLVIRANEKNNHDNIQYKCLDIMQPGAMEYLNKYVIEAKKNGLEKDDQRNETESTKEVKDLDVKETGLGTKVSTNPTTKFNVVFCFSVTMWIHLNHGDQGLLEFLDKISSLGKYLILENQLWKCYRNAQRRIVRNAGKRNDTRDGQGKIEENDRDHCDRNCDGGRQTEKNVDKMKDLPDTKPKTDKDDRKDVRNNRRGKCSQPRGKGNKESEVGFKHYRELKLRSNVDKEIDAYLIHKCNARKLYESEANEWGRVITVYEIV